ncbi:nitroreductase family protein [Paenibacillus agricola]|uniref:Putative NAD(P)H nitroreductase n=1 Tax=Paenibacillus agricola TaxID=2716264 RepID=A0ABX0J9I1_9BACL|nr:nitroreductase [Paenibacillus agricola]NHN30819.1 nitroreductase [Paenibacillus agricola]
MSIAHTIRERRSIRQFREQQVPVDLILRLLNDAVWAPNHGLREPWRFIVVERNEAKVKMADLMLASLSHLKRVKLLPAKLKQLMKHKYSQIPANLIVVMREDKDEHKQEEDYAAICCLIQNFQLLAWEQQLGMIWSTMEFIRSPLFCQGVGVQANERIVGVLHMGYFDKAPKPKSRTSAEKKLTLL